MLVFRHLVNYYCNMHSFTSGSDRRPVVGPTGSSGRLGVLGVAPRRGTRRTCGSRASDECFLGEFTQVSVPGRHPPLQKCHKQVVREPVAAEFEAAVKTLKLLADPTRLRIVWALLHGEHSVNDLASHVGVRPTAVSQHLAKLRLSGVVRTRRDGNHIFYAADNEHIERLASDALLHADHQVTGGRHHTTNARTA